MGLNVQLLRSSFDIVIEREPALTKRFYEIMFDRYPQARPLFHRNAPEVQQKMLTETLVAVLDHLEDAAWLRDTLHGMGAKHLDYGITDDMYEWVVSSLLATIAEVAGDDWNDELAEAWSAALGAVASLMLEGAAAARTASATG